MPIFPNLSRGTTSNGRVIHRIYIVSSLFSKFSNSLVHEYSPPKA